MTNKHALLFVLLACTAFSTTLKAAADDCVPLDPQARHETVYDNRITASVQTTLKIAAGQADWEHKSHETLEAMQSGFPLEGRYAIMMRAQYQFCTMVSRDTTIGPEKKVELYSQFMQPFLLIDATSTEKFPKPIPIPLGLNLPAPSTYSVSIYALSVKEPEWENLTSLLVRTGYHVNNECGGGILEGVAPLVWTDFSSR